ncbi:MAG: insulinase family protein [Paludibacteraceae bacterium]|nr:insulinase family protein [Paludibacteraceae bacterium]
MKKISVLFLGLIVALALSAQQPQQLPLDSAVRFGQLPNGLTYYIRHNEQPKQRCEFHIAQAVGAILEEDNQNGLAHFLEHMAFNGTQHFPGKGIITYFESIGVNFGGDINAYTSLDETVYRLSNVPTTREGIVDSALLVMHDWACGLLLLPEEIDAERGVIREEWRTRFDANFRLYTKLNYLIYPNSQYAIRNVIGDTAVINNFSYEALRAYYKKWYGPDNQAIIVVGDIDVDAIEAKIKALWADVPERENRGERPLYTIEDNEKPLVAIVTDPEARNTQIQLQYKHNQIPAEFRNTDQAYVIDVIHDLIHRIMIERLNEKQMDPECPFMGAYANYREEVKLKDAFCVYYVPKEGQEVESLKDALLFVEKMSRYGFTNAELERAKTQMLSDYETAYNGRATRENIALAQEYINNFEDGDPIPGIEWEYTTLQGLLPMLPLEAVNQLVKQYAVGEPTIAIAGPEKPEVKIPTENEVLAMLTAAKAAEIEAPVEEQVDNTLIKNLPKAGKIKKTTTDATFGTTTFTLSNGIRVIVKPTKFKEDEIMLHAYAPGGIALVNTEDVPSAKILPNALEYMGLGDFDFNALRKALTGKNVNMSIDLNEYTDVEGYSTVKDLETLFQLVYLGFTAPRRDDKAFNSLMSLIENSIANKAAQPDALFNDSVTLMRADHNPRAFVLNKESLGKVDLDVIMNIHKTLFANPGSFTFTIVGNVDPQDKAFRKMLCQYIGSMKAKGKKSAFKDSGVRRPAGLQKNYFALNMQTRKASNFIEYSSYDIPYTLDNALNMRIIGRILDTRYLESIREREGGSYGVGVAGRVTRHPVDCAFLLMSFDTDPEKQERLMAIIHEEVQTIAQNGPLAQDLNKEKAALLKDHEQDLEDNEWWSSILQVYDVYGLNYITDFVPAVNALTGESVQAMLNKLLEAKNMYEVVMTPAN